MRWTWVVALAMASVIARAERAAPPVASEILTVIVLNHAAVPDRILREMFHDLELILTPAGIPAVFLVCPVSLEPSRPALCSEPLRPDRVLLQLLPGQPVERVHSVGSSTLDRATGTACIKLYANLAEFIARDSGWSWSELLAHLAAHEIGHILLASGEHSRNGIMRAVWSPAELLVLRHPQALFDGRQAAKMQLALATRHLMAQARNAEH